MILEQNRVVAHFSVHITLFAIPHINNIILCHWIPFDPSHKELCSIITTLLLAIWHISNLDIAMYYLVTELNYQTKYL